jgi:hypothetical protein
MPHLMRHPEKLWPGSAANTVAFQVLVLNPHCSAAERSVRARISVDTLSERPNVRVRVDPACVRFVRAGPTGGRGQGARGGFLGGTLSLPRKKGCKKSFFKILPLFISLLAPKKRTKEKAPGMVYRHR